MSQIEYDCHTHTISSGHAYSTLEENLNSALGKGMKGLAITDHGPAMPGGPDEIFFFNLRSLPPTYKGLRLLRGLEANIVSHEGKLDVSERLLKKLDFCIASYHEICIEPADESTHTDCWLSIAQNQYVDLLGHPGRGRFPFDVDSVIKACKTNHKAVEINNHTLSRTADKQFCQQIALACMKYDVSIFVNSDAHFSPAIGTVKRAMSLLSEIDFPDRLIANLNTESLQMFLQARGKKL